MKNLADDSFNEPERELIHLTAEKLRDNGPAFLRRRRWSDSAFTLSLSPSSVTLEQIAQWRRQDASRRNAGPSASKIVSDLKSCCGLDERDFGFISRMMSLPDLDALGEEAALVGSQAASCIELAVAGDIRSAVLAVPYRSLEIGSGYSPVDIVRLIAFIASYHLIASACEEARSTRAAMFRPCGNLPAATTTGPRGALMAPFGKNILDQAGQTISVLALYRPGLTSAEDREIRDATAVEGITISTMPDIVAKARSYMARLEMRYGDRMPAMVAGMHQVASKFARYQRRYIAAEMGILPRNTTINGAHGINALSDLWMACEMVAGWMTFTANGHRPLGWNEAGEEETRLDRAVMAIRHDHAIEAPTYGQAELFTARKLFYLLRALIVKDFDVAGKGKSVKQLTHDAIEQVIEQAEGMNPSLGPLRTGFEDAANKKYPRGHRTNGTAVELLPSFWIKLHR